MAHGKHRFRLEARLGKRDGVDWARIRVLPETCARPVASVVPGPRRLQGHSCLALRRLSVTTTPYQVWERYDPTLLMRRAKGLLGSISAWSGMSEPTDHVDHADASAADAHASSGAEQAAEAAEGRAGGADVGGVAEGGQDGSGSAGGVHGGSKSVENPRSVENPTEYSHWLSRSLPLDDLTRLRLLACDSTTDRLRMAIKLLEVGVCHSVLVCNAAPPPDTRIDNTHHHPSPTPHHPSPTSLLHPPPSFTNHPPTPPPLPRCRRPRCASFAV